MTTKHRANIHADWLESFVNDEADFSKEDMQECVKLLRTISALEAEIERLKAKESFVISKSKVVRDNENPQMRFHAIPTRYITDSKEVLDSRLAMSGANLLEGLKKGVIRSQDPS